MDLLLTALPAFLAAAVATPLLARSAARMGLLDTPSARSTHTRPVPRVGGIGIFIGLQLGFCVFVWRTHLRFDAAWPPYLLPVLFYFAIGVADDRVRLVPRNKFILQALAAAAAVALGLRWGGEALGPFGAIEFGALTPYMTWLWLVAVVVLVNFVDGIDLITSTIAIVVLGAAAGAGAGPGEGALYLVVAGALLGMVVWNVTPARVFPGDAGTHVLGFFMATVACGVPGAGAGAPDLARAMPWAAASAPLLPGVIDVAMGLYGKLKRGIPLADAHSDHLYQRLTKIGWSHAASALRYGALALIALLLVTRVAPELGLGVCFAVAAVVLLGHLGGGLGATRAVPWGASGNGDSA